MIRSLSPPLNLPSVFLAFFFLAAALPAQETPRSVSGVYPHLAMFNDEAECGTGAVVPWADRLWAVTYGPHSPLGSSDKLYEITPELRQIVRPESVGGTHANRMIHRESEQLFIGVYAIDKERNVRVISPKKMPGRQTGNARHLTDPAGKIYFATMEEGLYEVDVKTLEVTGLIKDGNANQGAEEDRPAMIGSKLPGYHGKGFYSSQGRLVYANNGDQGPRVMFDPTVDSGALAQWTGSGDWQLVRRNQFTEVTGPGGIYGNDHPETDPIWSIGWDHRSLILMVLHEGKWTSYRLPKASHSYDGAHGWHTEWPRIRDIGEDTLLMTMHGTFWKFPKDFTPKNSAGIVPRSTYLKVIGDFCAWQDNVVCACDDTAKSEFTNRRKVKGELAGPGQSQSNLWFLEREQLDSFGPLIGRGGPWVNDAVKAGEWSEPFLFAGYENRQLYLQNDGSEDATVTIAFDMDGTGTWTELPGIGVQANPAQCSPLIFESDNSAVWVRMKTDKDVKSMTAMFQYRNSDPRGAQPATKFNGLARIDDAKVSGGVIHARGANLRTLRFVAHNEEGPLGVYDLDGELNLKKTDDPAGLKWTSEKAAIPVGVLDTDEASVLIVDEKGRWRLPKGDPARDKDGPLGPERVCREVATERDLFHAHGTFYELPAENSGGFQKIRPIASHPYWIKDYASFRGMIVMSGLSQEAAADNPHVIVSDDGRCALWCGVIDDLWELGKPHGIGGPWKNTAVKAGVPSDPYLMTGYDKKSFEISHDGAEPVGFRVEIDVCGNGQWRPLMTNRLSGKSEKFDISHVDAYWVRVVADKDVTATATFYYE